MDFQRLLGKGFCKYSVLYETLGMHKHLGNGVTKEHMARVILHGMRRIIRVFEFGMKISEADKGC